MGRVTLGCIAALALAVPAAVVPAATAISVRNKYRMIGLPFFLFLEGDAASILASSSVAVKRGFRLPTRRLRAYDKEGESHNDEGDQP